MPTRPIFAGFFIPKRETYASGKSHTVRPGQDSSLKLHLWGESLNITLGIKKMDWKEILFTPEFKEYRKRQTEEIARMVSAELKGDIKPDYLKGLFDMANKIIKLPSALIKDEKLRMELYKLTTEDLTDLTIKLVREQVTRKENV